MRLKATVPGVVSCSASEKCDGGCTRPFCNEWKCQEFLTEALIDEE